MWNCHGPFLGKSSFTRSDKVHNWMLSDWLLVIAFSTAKDRDSGVTVTQALSDGTQLLSDGTRILTSGAIFEEYW